MGNKEKLKNVLLGNAVFSIISGLILIFFRNPIGELMRVKLPSILLYVGIGLLFFAGSIIWQATRTTFSGKRIKAIIIQDWLWVIGSIIIIALQSFDLSVLGYQMIFGVAILVGVFAILQQKYLNIYLKQH